MRTARQEAKRKALEYIKELHRTAPKYTYSEESQADIIKLYGVEVVKLKGEYVRGSDGQKARLLDGDEAVSAEEFASRHFGRLGFSVLPLESVPFHVLFGIFMWLVIQDPGDPRVRIVGFGSRTACEGKKSGQLIRTSLPDDFGSEGYGLRRKEAIDEHLSSEMCTRRDLEWLFDYWLEPSADLRQYLWAHRDEDVQTARELLRILPAPLICDILRYLVADYWRHYCGWPDLLVYKAESFFLAEIKSSNDKLSQDQRGWIRANATRLKLPFKLVKIHRST